MGIFKLKSLTSLGEGKLTCIGTMDPRDLSHSYNNSLNSSLQQPTDPLLQGTPSMFASMFTRSQAVNPHTSQFSAQPPMIPSSNYFPHSATKSSEPMPFGGQQAFNPMMMPMNPAVQQHMYEAFMQEMSKKFFEGMGAFGAQPPVQMPSHRSQPQNQPPIVPQMQPHSFQRELPQSIPSTAQSQKGHPRLVEEAPGNIEDLFTRNMQNLDAFYATIATGGQTPAGQSDPRGRVNADFSRKERPAADSIDERLDRSGIHNMSDIDISLPYKSELVGAGDLSQYFMMGSTIQKTDDVNEQLLNTKGSGDSQGRQPGGKWVRTPNEASAGSLPREGSTNQRQGSGHSLAQNEDQRSEIFKADSLSQKPQEEMQGTNGFEKFSTEFQEESQHHQQERPGFTFDDIPIKPLGHKTFDQLLEENLRNEGQVDSGPVVTVQREKKKKGKKEFLKKGKGQHLSNAVQRKQKENQGSSISKDSMDGDEGPSDEQEEDVLHQKNMNSEKNDRGIPDPKAQAKGPTKFLGKGQGRGGGNVNKAENKRTVTEADEQESLSKGRGRSVNDSRPTASHAQIAGSHLTDSDKKARSPDSYSKEYKPSRYLDSGKKSEENEEPAYRFNDAEEWRDFGKEDSPPKSRGSPQDGGKSSLVSRYFKPEKGKKSASTARSDEEVNDVAPTNLSKEAEEAIVRRYVKEKIDSLNEEIAKFKLENERVAKLRRKHEEMLKSLNKEMEAMKKKKETEMAEFEEWKEEEMRKVRKEKKIAERQSKAIANMPNRKEREEINALKAQLSKLVEESKIKDQRNRLTFERMRKQVEELTAKNSELQAELKVVEQARVATKPSTSQPKKQETGLGKKSVDQVSELKKSTSFSGKNSNEIFYEELGFNYEELNVSVDKKKRTETAGNLKNRATPDFEDDGDGLSENEDEYDENANLESYEDILNKDYHKGRGGKGASTSEKLKEVLAQGRRKSIDTGVREEKTQRAAPQSPTQTKSVAKKIAEIVEKTASAKPQSKEVPAKKAPETKAVTTPPMQENVEKAKAKDVSFEERRADEPASNLGIRSIRSDNDYKYTHNKWYLKYQKTKDQVGKIMSQNVSSDGKIQRVYADGKKEVVFQNGVKKEIFPDGYTIVHFTNRDVKQTLPDGSVIYFFSEADTTQTSIQNGPQVYRFNNDQIEFHFVDGSKEIKFADGTEKYINPQGEEETVFVDGTIQKVGRNKMKVILYPNGQKVPQTSSTKSYFTGHNIP
eukprot:TRINITY_DN13787_c0_g2_i1.p1 TRINITY_DN13787_c0_g2~~TRINITY_DN13787_c0_g2_i1.p1  ORF type:complete len:1237 (-),score=401.48 TRINITY_DN13787_c0_g2_i1:135-3845(-)